ncbi:hypothetical protein B0H12DRAFT_1270721 [Mycena haematopus]|nr:hypothetical protein B0H12DRAFT_1270721 [Mycena haematopus]
MQYEPRWLCATSPNTTQYVALARCFLHALLEVLERVMDEDERVQGEKDGERERTCTTRDLFLWHASSAHLPLNQWRRRRPEELYDAGSVEKGLSSSRRDREGEGENAPHARDNLQTFFGTLAWELRDSVLDRAVASTEQAEELDIGDQRVIRRLEQAHIAVGERGRRRVQDGGEIAPVPSRSALTLFPLHLPQHTPSGVLHALLACPSLPSQSPFEGTSIPVPMTTPITSLSASVSCPCAASTPPSLHSTPQRRGPSLAGTPAQFD